MDSVPCVITRPVAATPQRDDVPTVGIAPALPVLFTDRLVVGDEPGHVWYRVPSPAK
ncbi:hypothetical protein [Nocardioides sp. KR10-350]|uniref:hypothetical protein n=1 Tax=Nocardioides cheoyonin TaxID=3156615 RepID=UPI0032B50FE5